jgi:hypothetical protein
MVNICKELFDLRLVRMGYNRRNKCVEFLTKKEARNWNDVKIIVFDAPQAIDKPYEQRLNILQQRTQLESV